MKPNESKFSKCDFKKKFAIYVRGSHCGSLPQVLKNLTTSLLIHVGFQTKNMCANLISPIDVTCFTSFTLWCETNDIW